MSKGNVDFIDDNEYYTPPELVALFGTIDYDPATTLERAKILGIVDYDTEESDGLKQDWTRYKRIWINPPFTIKHLFWEKAWETYNQVKNEIYFLCPIEFLTTKRFHNFFRGGIIYLPNGRIKFQKSDGTRKSPAFGSVVIKLGDNEPIVKLLNLENV